MRRLAAYALLVMITFGAAAAAHRSEQFPPDLFPAQFILGARADIRLTPDQIKAVEGLIEEYDKSSLIISQAIAPESRKLRELIAVTQIDEPQALAQFESILNLERQGRRAGLLHLIRLKNLLTAEQQNWLMSVQTRRGHGPRGTQ